LNAGDISGDGSAYNNMGICLGEIGKEQVAIEMYKKKLEIAQQW
jgi:hypothetical protein